MTIALNQIVPARSLSSARQTRFRFVITQFEFPGCSAGDPVNLQSAGEVMRVATSLLQPYTLYSVPSQLRGLLGQGLSGIRISTFPIVGVSSRETIDKFRFDKASDITVDVRYTQTPWVYDYPSMTFLSTVGNELGVAGVGLTTGSTERYVRITGTKMIGPTDQDANPVPVPPDWPVDNMGYFAFIDDADDRTLEGTATNFATGAQIKGLRWLRDAFNMPFSNTAVLMTHGTRTGASFVGTNTKVGLMHRYVLDITADADVLLTNALGEPVCPIEVQALCIMSSSDAAERRFLYPMMTTEVGVNRVGPWRSIAPSNSARTMLSHPMPDGSSTLEGLFSYTDIANIPGGQRAFNNTELGACLSGTYP